MLGLRGSFGSILEEYLNYSGLVDRDWFYVSADTSTSGGLSRLKDRYPSRFVETGIAEQAAVSIATGIALEGLPVIAGSFAPFIVGRAWEQMRLAAYMEANLIVLGFGSGLGLSHLGYTHCSMEDYDLVDAIPGTKIYEPSSPLDMMDTLCACFSESGVKYIRLTGDGPTAKVFSDSNLLESRAPGIRVIKNESSSKTLVTNGHIATRLVEEFDYLETHSLILISSLDSELLVENCADLLSGQVTCCHESYSEKMLNVVTNATINLGNPLPVQSLKFDKKFSKPGTFNFVSDCLGFKART